MNIEQLKERLQQIIDELITIQEELMAENNTEKNNIDELEDRANKLIKEKRDLQNQINTIEENARTRQKLIDDIANGTKGITVRTFEEDEEKNMEFKTVDEAIRTQEYENAFIKRFLSESPKYTEIEKRALDTTEGKVLVPHQWMEEIFDQMKEQHPILEDLSWNSINAIVEIPKRTAITAGDAAVVTEGQCAIDETNTFISVQVDLIEIQKKVTITAKMGVLLPNAFKQWFINEIRDRIGHQLAVQAITKIKELMLAENKISGIADAKTLLSVYGAVEGIGNVRVYANRKTLYGALYTIAGATGQDAFIPDLHGAPSLNLFGGQIREESAMADEEVLVLYPNDVFFNVPEGIRVKQTEDDCFKLVISGIAFMGLALKYDKAAALLTITPQA